MNTRPNFLYIMTDQHRADWLGCAGHPVVKTPNIDVLAARGTRFDQCFVASPICMPNRASLLTGRYPSVHGLRYNGCVLPSRANTFVDVLRAGGYKTACIGKSHIQPFTDRAPFERDPFETGPIEEAWKPDPTDYTKEEPAHYDANGRFDFPTPYYGFEHIDMVTRHGDRAGGHYRQWFRERFPNWQELTDPANELPHDYSCPQAFRTPIPEEGYSTSYIRDCAVDYLQARTQDEDPFFAYVSFPDPHHPFNPPGKYWDMYDPKDFALSLPFERHENPPPPLRHARNLYEAGMSYEVKQSCFMATEQHLREAMALTAGMITMIDDAIGDMINTLEQSGQLDNTIVIFNSDHGDYLGDFNMLLKGAWPRDAITRVPLIWTEPDANGARVSSAMTSTIDISATILDRAGLKPYYGIQGQSFLKSISENIPHREQLLIEYNDMGKRMGFEKPARMRQLLTEDWQITLYKDEPWGELYDRKADPHSLCNQWDNTEFRDIRAAMTQALTHVLIDQMDESPRSNRLA